MDKKVLISVAVVVVVLAVGGFLFMQSSKNSTQENSTTQIITQQTSTPAETAAAMASSSPSNDTTNEGVVKELTIEGSSFKFVPSTLSVNKGDRVKITFKNSGGMHDFAIDELNIKSKVIDSGQQDVIEFTADKAGSFEYYCSVGNHRQMGMKGTLTVK